MAYVGHFHLLYDYFILRRYRSSWILTIYYSGVMPFERFFFSIQKPFNLLMIPITTYGIRYSNVT